MAFDIETMKLPELRKLAAEIAAEIMVRENVVATGSTKTSSFLHWYQAVTESLKNEIGIDMPPAPVFSRQGFSKTFSMSLPAADRLVAAFRPPNGRVLRLLEERPIRLRIMQTLYIWMNKRGVGISVGSVCRNMQNVQAAVAEEFPGYLRSGFLYLIVK